MNKHTITVTTPLEDIEAVIGRLQTADSQLVTLVGETSFEAGPNVDNLQEALASSQRLADMRAATIEQQAAGIASREDTIASQREMINSMMQANRSVLETVRQYIIDEELQDSDFAKTMIEEHDMAPFTRSARVTFTVSRDVVVDLDEVPHEIDEDTLDEAVVEHVSQNIGLFQQGFRIWIGDHHISAEADVLDTDVTDSSVEFEG